LKRSRAQAELEEEEEGEAQSERQVPEDEVEAALARLEAEERAAAARGDGYGDEDGSAVTAAMDAAHMKRLVLAFERALTRNQEQRVKHVGEPAKYVESEVELDEAIKALSAIAAHPMLFAPLVALRAHESVLALLTHENTDIVLDALELLAELTEGDEEGGVHVQELVIALVEQPLLPLLVTNLGRLSEAQSDEKAGVLRVLQVLDNLLELQPSLATRLVQETPLLTWLLKRLQVKEFDEVKQFASELLAVLLQHAPRQVCAALPAASAVDALLTAVARYKKSEQDPQSPDEEEFVENVFDALCVVAVSTEHRKAFAQAEGLKLLQIMLKNKARARRGALRLLAHVLQGDVKACRRWVQLPALGTLCAALMKKGSARHRKAFDDRQDDEHVLSALWHLLASLTAPQDAELRGRVLAKFTEEDMEKLERLCELHDKYAQRVRAAEQRVQQEREESDESAMEEERLLQRLDAGGYVLQLCDLLLATVVCELHHALPAVTAKAQQLLTLNNSSLADVAQNIADFANELGDQQTESEGKVEGEGEGESKEETRRLREGVQRMARTLLELDQEADTR